MTCCAHGIWKMFATVRVKSLLGTRMFSTCERFSKIDGKRTDYRVFMEERGDLKYKWQSPVRGRGREAGNSVERARTNA